MIKSLEFSAEPIGELKVNMDLILPEEMELKFSVSGVTDKRTLKRLIRIIKSAAKDGKVISNKT